MCQFRIKLLLHGTKIILPPTIPGMFSIITFSPHKISQFTLFAALQSHWKMLKRRFSFPLLLKEPTHPFRTLSNPICSAREKNWGFFFSVKNKGRNEWGKSTWDERGIKRMWDIYSPGEKKRTACFFPFISFFLSRVVDVGKKRRFACERERKIEEGSFLFFRETRLVCLPGWLLC